MRVFVYALIFGEYPALHRRLLDSFKRCVPPLSEAEVYLWCNTIGNESCNIVEKSGYSALFSSDNVPKYKAMRQMFECPKMTGADSDWVAWFDDDSYITHPDWFERHHRFITMHRDAVYLGQKWFVHHLPGQDEFIRQASWFKGKPFEKFPTRSKELKDGVAFAQGAAWWLRVDILRGLDWPDPRLSHNGGDTLLGEAVRQQGLPFHNFHYGVKINDSKRRGHHERPAGSLVDTRR